MVSKALGLCSILPERKEPVNSPVIGNPECRKLHARSRLLSSKLWVVSCFVLQSQELSSSQKRQLRLKGAVAEL